MDQEGEEVPGAGRHLTLKEKLSSLALKIKEDEGQLLEAGLLHLIVWGTTHKDGLDVHDVQGGWIIVLVDLIKLKHCLLAGPLDVECLSY